MMKANVKWVKKKRFWNLFTIKLFWISVGITNTQLCMFLKFIHIISNQWLPEHVNTVCCLGELFCKYKLTTLPLATPPYVSKLKKKIKSSLWCLWRPAQPTSVHSPPLQMISNQTFRTDASFIKSAQHKAPSLIIVSGEKSPTCWIHLIN